MAIKEENGLQHSMTNSVDDAQMDLIDMKANPDPLIARTAKLNQDLFNVIDNFVGESMMLSADPVETMIALSHGVISVSGTIAANSADRKLVLDKLKESLDNKWEAMSDIVLKNEG